MTSSRPDNLGAVSTGLLPPHWRAPRQQTSEDNYYWPDNYNRNNCHFVLMPQPGALQHDGEGPRQSPLRPCVSVTSAFLSTGWFLLPHWLQPGNRDLSTATLFAVCLTELQILCKNSNVFIHKKYRTRAALILMQQFKEKKNPQQIIYFIPLPSLSKFGRRCWESFI